MKTGEKAVYPPAHTEALDLMSDIALLEILKIQNKGNKDARNTGLQE